MRDWFLLIMALLASCPGCRSRQDANRPTPAPAETGQRLQLEGIEVTVPSAFIPLEEDRTQRLLRSAQAAEPGSDTSLVALRSPEGIKGGMVYVQRVVMRRPPPPVAVTVQQAIGLAVAEARQLIEAAGVQVEDARTRPQNGGVETCLRGHQRTPSGQSMLFRMCTLVYVGAAVRLRMLVASCMTGAGVSSCDKIIESRRFSPDGALPLDTRLATFAAPALPGVRRSSVGGLTFGISLRAFQRACRAGGYLVDRFDWKNELPVVRAWVKEGLIAQCSGLPGSLGLGTVTQVNALFKTGRLTSISIYLRETGEEIEEKLATVYPEKVQELGRTVHLIRREATGDEIASVGLGPTRVPGARSVVTFLSRANLDIPSPMQPPVLLRP